MTHVPYKGVGAPVMTDLASGILHVALTPMAAVASLAAEGKVRLLVATNDERSARFVSTSMRQVRPSVSPARRDSRLIAHRLARAPPRRSARTSLTLAAVDRVVHATIFELNVEIYQRRTAVGRRKGTRPTANARDTQHAR